MRPVTRAPAIRVRRSSAAIICASACPAAANSCGEAARPERPARIPNANAASMRSPPVVLVIIANGVAKDPGLTGVEGLMPSSNARS